MGNQLGRLILTCVTVFSVLLLQACGGGGGGSSGSAPATAVSLVEVSSAGSSSMDVSWLPATNSATPADQMKYEVHASTDTTYTPGPATLKSMLTGQVSTRLTGLLAGTKYTVIVVAVDAAGQRVNSTPLTATTSTLPSETIPGVKVSMPTDAQVQSIEPNQITLSSSAETPTVGQFIAGTAGDGFLRKVTGVSTTAGQTVVTTQPASLNQVVSHAEISSAFKLGAVPTETAMTAVGVAIDPATTQKSVADWQWSQTRFRLSSAPVEHTAVKTPYDGAVGVVSSGQSNIDTSAKEVSKTGNWGEFRGPDTIGVLANTQGTVTLKLKVNKDDETFLSNTRIPIAICKVEVIESDAEAPNLVTPGGMTATSTEDVAASNGSIYTAIREANQSLTINSNFVDAREKPYVVKLRAYLDEAGSRCAERGTFGFWKEKLDISVNVVVVSTPNFPQQESKGLDFSKEFKVNNQVNFTFNPTLESEVTLDGAHLQKARLEAKTRATLDQVLTIEASAGATLDQTRTLITPRRFVKVYMAGSVPIVMSGEFTTDIRIQGSITGSLKATEEIHLGYENLSYGVEYKNGQWQTIQNITPIYNLKLSGEGGAEANLQISVLPRLSVKFYEAATGRLVVEPYLKAEAGIQGKVLADISPGAITTDADYWLSKGVLSGGVKAWLMADLTVMDQTIVKYPKTADINDYTTFQMVPLLADTPIVGIPALSSSVDTATINPLDSRAIRIRGAADNVPNPFKSMFGGPDSFLTFDAWQQPKVIAVNNEGYQFIPTPPGANPEDVKGDVWVVFTKPGTYTVRLAGNSTMGGWARQITEQVITIHDDNGNGIPDEWEQRFNLTGASGAAIASADPDSDGRTNAQEWAAGTNPITSDTAAIVASTQNPTVGDTVRFWLSSVMDNVTSVVWKIGDTVLTVLSNLTDAVTHLFDSTGDVTVKATLRDASNHDVATYSTTVSVSQPLVCPEGQVAQGGVCVSTSSMDTLFVDEFNGSVLDTSKWDVQTANSCCGSGHPATWTVASGKLNLDVAGGSDGYMGVGDGTGFIPKGVSLTGDFEVSVSLKEIYRQMRGYKDNSGIGINAGKTWISIHGNYSGYYWDHSYGTYDKHRIQAAGVNSEKCLLDESLDPNQYYQLELRIRRTNGQGYVGYRMSGASAWTEQPCTLEAAPVPSMSIGSGDGGGTRSNGMFGAEVERFEVKGTRGLTGSFTVPATAETGVVFTSPSTTKALQCSFTATGLAAENYQSPYVSPSGMSGYYVPTATMPGAQILELVTKRGSGAYERVGSAKTLQLAANETLAFIINDAGYAGNSGQFDVTYTCSEIPQPTWTTNPANGHQYAAVDCGTWTQCEAQAVALGGHLVSVNDAAENAWLVSTFTPDKNYWIGLTDKDQEGVWKWTSGEVFGYSNWVSGEPNNGYGGNASESYVHMNFNYPSRTNLPGQWNDAQDVITGTGVGGIPYNSSAIGLFEKASTSNYSVEWHYPSFGSLLSGRGANPISITSGDGVEITGFLDNPKFDVDMIGSKIVLSNFRSYVGYPGLAQLTSSTFNGFVLRSLDGGFFGADLAVDINGDGDYLDAGDLSPTATSTTVGSGYVAVNLSGRSFSSATVMVINTY